MYILYYPNVVRKFTYSLFPVRMPEDVIKTIQNETEKEKRAVFSLSLSGVIYFVSIYIIYHYNAYNIMI